MKLKFLDNFVTIEEEHFEYQNYIQKNSSIIKGGEASKSIYNI
jgi:hypothetical protein